MQPIKLLNIRLDPQLSWVESSWVETPIHEEAAASISISISIQTPKDKMKTMLSLYYQKLYPIPC